MKTILRALFIFLLLMPGCISHPHKKVTANRLDEKVVVERVKLALRKVSAENFQNVEVGVADGIVTLRGTVPGAREQLRAEQIARQIDQVTSVNNELKIRSGSR